MGIHPSISFQFCPVLLVIFHVVEVGLFWSLISIEIVDLFWSVSFKQNLDVLICVISLPIVGKDLLASQDSAYLPVRLSWGTYSVVGKPTAFFTSSPACWSIESSFCSFLCLHLVIV